jgi:hypothetical protein
MDPTPISILLSALSIAGSALQPVADEAIQDGYRGLRALLVRKFGEKDPRIEARLNDYAEDPETFEKPTAKLLTQVGADTDQEVVDRATELLQRSETRQPGITGGLVGQIQASGGKVNVIQGNVQTINM